MEALKAGSTVAEFWEMTLHEVQALIEAAAWRQEQEQRGRAWLAWHIGALMRAKRFPPLSRLLGAPKPKPPTEEELEGRREEFEEMKAAWQRRH